MHELLFIASEHRESGQEGCGWPLFLACSVSCPFLIYRLIQAVPPGKISESAWCLMAVFHPRKSQEQPGARLFELGLKIRCWCCFYGTLNIYQDSYQKKHRRQSQEPDIVFNWLPGECLRASVFLHGKGGIIHLPCPVP